MTPEVKTVTVAPGVIRTCDDQNKHFVLFAFSIERIVIPVQSIYSIRKILKLSRFFKSKKVFSVRFLLI